MTKLKIVVSIRSFLTRATLLGWKGQYPKSVFLKILIVIIGLFGVNAHSDTEERVEIAREYTKNFVKTSMSVCLEACDDQLDKMLSQSYANIKGQVSKKSK